LRLVVVAFEGAQRIIRDEDLRGPRLGGIGQFAEIEVRYLLCRFIRHRNEAPLPL
jgi:hypothetical protein